MHKAESECFCKFRYSEWSVKSSRRIHLRPLLQLAEGLCGSVWACLFVLWNNPKCIFVALSPHLLSRSGVGQDQTEPWLVYSVKAFFGCVASMLKMSFVWVLQDKFLTWRKISSHPPQGLQDMKSRQTNFSPHFTKKHKKTGCERVKYRATDCRTQARLGPRFEGSALNY